MTEGGKYVGVIVMIPINSHALSARLVNSPGVHPTAFLATNLSTRSLLYLFYPGKSQCSLNPASLASGLFSLCFEWGSWPLKNVDYCVTILLKARPLWSYPLGPTLVREAADPAFQHYLHQMCVQPLASKESQSLWRASTATVQDSWEGCRL